MHWSCQNAETIRTNWVETFSSLAPNNEPFTTFDNLSGKLTTVDKISSQ